VRYRRGSHDLWLPKSPQDLDSLPDAIHETESCRVVCSAPGVAIKYRGGDHAEEVHALYFARNELSLPVPSVLHHPPLHRKSGTSLPGTRRSGVWYICMEKLPGTPLHKAIHTMSTEELDHVAEQLKSILTRMGTVRPKTLGSVTGGPYRNFFFPSHLGPKHPFKSAGEFIDQYRQILMLFCTEEFTESVLARLPRNAAIRFAHGDLLPKNILVNGSNVSAILDWSTAGFYPAYWEYCRMHDPAFMTEPWNYVLHRIFPTQRRQTEIDVVRQLMDILAYTF
jgi:hypothetical protein